MNKNDIRSNSAAALVGRAVHMRIRLMISIPLPRIPHIKECLRKTARPQLPAARSSTNIFITNAQVYQRIASGASSARRVDRGSSGPRRQSPVVLTSITWPYSFTGPASIPAIWSSPQHCTHTHTCFSLHEDDK